MPQETFVHIVFLVKVVLGVHLKDGSMNIHLQQVILWLLQKGLINEDYMQGRNYTMPKKATAHLEFFFSFIYM